MGVQAAYPSDNGGTSGIPRRQRGYEPSSGSTMGVRVGVTPLDGGTGGGTGPTTAVMMKKRRISSLFSPARCASSSPGRCQQTRSCCPPPAEKTSTGTRTSTSRRTSTSTSVKIQHEGRVYSWVSAEEGASAEGRVGPKGPAKRGIVGWSGPAKRAGVGWQGPARRKQRVSAECGSHRRGPCLVNGVEAKEGCAPVLLQEHVLHPPTARSPSWHDSKARGNQPGRQPTSFCIWGEKAQSQLLSCASDLLLAGQPRKWR